MNGSPVPSAIEVKTLDPLSDSDWDRRVRSHPDYTVFHSAAWAKVLGKTYRHKPIYLHFSRQGELVALVPMMEVRSSFTGRRGVCLPFSDFCDPLLFDKAEAGSVLDKLSELGRERNWKYFELRGGQEALPATAVLAAVVFFQFGKNSVYKFGASNELLQEFRGSNLVMWEAIRLLLGDGASMLHFGRTSLDNDGLRRFKLGWGTVEEAIEYFQFDIGAQAWKSNGHNGSGFYNNIFRRL